ncbi:putative FAD-linked oxidoreductase [Cladobotryum mycophilum]|uniref:FAD-linked oxidoreductase n=1 Tax=Cladobotryum mycophilum TaxID=491253 RepID=A0ABR0SAQ9_9HYPO
MKAALFGLLWLYAIVVEAIHDCKVTPKSPTWPSPLDWEQLNQTISGKLLNPRPPASVCHHNEPNFNPSQCVTVTTQWNSSVFHADDPLSIDWPNFNNDSCLPDPEAPCNREGFPTLVVNATSASDVQGAVNFSREKNVRLVVKATGHDVLGRSTGPNSLSIWTHYMRGITFDKNFQPRGCSSPLGLSSATIAAGMQMGDIYAAVARHNLTIVGGDVPTVGIIGLLTGGGYGPLSSTYGLAADSALEFDIVTADGNLLTVNECQNSDLFFALRGGSAGTFGVVTSVTVRTFPNTRITAHILTINTTADSEAFWDTTSLIHSDLPRLADGGFSGQYFILPNSSSAAGARVLGTQAAGLQFGPSRGIISWALNIMNQPATAANKLVEPLLQQLKNATWNTDISIETEVQEFQDFSSYADVFDGPQVVGVDGLIGGRFLDRKALDGNRTALKEALKAAINPAGGIILGEMVMGKGVWDAQPRGGDSAVSKAWRSAITNTLIPVGWAALDASQKELVTSELTNKNMAALRRLAPDTGVYLNECDPMEPNFQHSFWGEKYGKLLQIKQKYDPQGVFFCHPCVGSEFWTVSADGQLCKI